MPPVEKPDGRPALSTVDAELPAVSMDHLPETANLQPDPDYKFVFLPAGGPAGGLRPTTHIVRTLSPNPEADWASRPSRVMPHRPRCRRSRRSAPRRPTKPQLMSHPKLARSQVDLPARVRV